MDELTDDVVAFLSEGTRTGKLGFTASDGRPLVAPVWFVVDNGTLAFNTGRTTAKGRALSRDSRAVMCVDDQPPPYSFVQVQGTVSISEDPQDVRDIATRAGATWAPTGRRNSAGVTVCRANSSCGCGRRRC